VGVSALRDLHSTSSSSSAQSLDKISRRVAGSGDRGFLICRLGVFWSDVEGCSRVMRAGGRRDGTVMSGLRRAVTSHEGG
jgi:hypothetical protein